MPRNSFTLNNNLDKLGVFGPATINGSDGDQTALIFGSATDVVLTATMERADFALASSDVTFSYNPASLQIEVRQGANLIASIANNAVSGTNLAFTDGGVNVKLGTNAAGDLVLQVQGDAGSAPQEIALDGTAHPLEVPADSTITSEVNGGDSPTPPTPIPTRVKIADVTPEMIAAGGYTIEDTAANLDPATEGSYAKLTKAASVIMNDSLDNLFANGGGLSVAATKALAITNLDTVKMRGSFEKLMTASDNLPESLAAKTLFYTVNSPMKDKVKLDDISVATVANSDAVIQAFFNTVTFEPTSLKPATAPKLGKYSILDKADAISAALADDTQKALLTDKTNCTGITVEDSVANISNIAMTLAGIKASVTKLDIDITDSLQALSGLGSSLKATLDTIPTSPSTISYTATDTGNVTLTLSSTGLTNLNTIKPELSSDLKSLSITADVAASETSGLTIDTTVSSTFLEKFTGKINFTGSDKGDSFTTKSDADTIDMGGGNDTLTISGGTIGEIIAGEGEDTITISGSTTKVTSIDMGDSADTTTNQKLDFSDGTVTTITGGSGQDAIDIKSGTLTNGTISLGAGNDTLTISKDAKVSGLTVNADNGTNSITVEAGKSSDGLTINLGDGADTVTLNASVALTTADNAVAKVLTINGFSGDKIQFSGTGFTGLTAEATTDASQTSETDITGKIAFNSDISKLLVADSETDLRALFTEQGNEAGKIKCLADTKNAILVTKDDTATKLNIWFIQGDTDATKADSDTVVLLGTVSNTEGITLSADSFATA